MTRYVFAFDVQDENVIRISEVYASKEAFDTNSSAQWFADYMEQAQPLLDGNPQFHMAAPQFINRLVRRSASERVVSQCLGETYIEHGEKRSPSNDQHDGLETG